MRRDFRLASALSATLVALALVVATPAVAQTPPPPPGTGGPATGGGDDDLPPPVSRRGDNDARTDDNTDPPPVRRDDPPPVPALAYHVVVDGQPKGPLDEAGLITLIKNGTLKAATKVWKSGMADWQPAGGIAELAALIEAHTPVAPPPPAASFYVVESGAQAGPFTLDQIKTKIAAGTFTAQSKVWRQGMSGWTAAGEVAELAELLRTAPDPEPKDALAFMKGRWEMGPINVPVQGVGPGTMKMTLQLAPDGTYRADVVLDFMYGNVPISRQTEGTGTFTAKYKSEDTIAITAKGRSSTNEVNRDTGAVGRPKIETVDFTFDFKVIDQNTLDDGGAAKWRRTD